MADENKEVVIVKEPEQEEKNDSSNMEMKIESPRTKKRKRFIEENQEKMQTIKEKDKKIIIEYETKALSKLCSDTGDQKIRKYIECYQQSEEGDIEIAKNAMLDLYKLEGQVVILKEAITFVTNDPIEIEIDESDPEELADILIASIRNRMAKLCSDCDCYYIVDREKKPKKFCSLCNVGMHDCSIESTDTTRKGEMWFCTECHSHFTKQIKPQMMKKHRNVIFKGFKPKETDKVNNEEISKMIKEVRRNSEENKTNEIEEEAEVMEVDPKSNDEPKKKDQNIKKMDTRDEDKNNNSQINKGKKICHFWITNKCKFGKNCNNEHPTRCREHMDWGKCLKKTKCELAHPKMCRSMLNENYCSRSNCWFNHPNERKNMFVFVNEKHGQNSNQNQRGPKRQDNQNMQGNPKRQDNQNMQGNPKTWQNNNMDRHQYSNCAPFLAGPTPSEAYMNPNRNMNMIKMMGDMFQEMSFRIMNMNMNC